MGKLDGHVAMVTGAGRGFGRAIAERLAAEGAKVALLARSPGEIGEAAAAIGSNALAVPCDVTDPRLVDSAVATVSSELGAIDILVSNAGIPGPFGPLWEVDPEAWWQAQAVHIRAPMLLLNRLLPGMIERGTGHAVCVSAKAARIVAPNLSAYCTGKIAQNRIVAEAAAELEGTGVAVFAIDPGFVFTKLARDTMEDPAAQKHLAGMVARLKQRETDPGADADLERCADRVLALVSGKYDVLSGNYYELDDDLDAALAERKSAQG
ncbi:SDR family NAD(P)-dependent oxidoreductase [Croceibacterium aestuarii]|uniref:SDR family NAD(P)-dependent oxidoreductase n=1 Tax=Croceibacterium aestuarii TaxID=3064139 RepID=UPI00272DE017|nr:SDR family oxidoreductase [Croceibacterium sp. D39]